MSRIIRLKISQMTYLSLCVFLIWFSQPQYCRSFSANENESWHISCYASVWHACSTKWLDTITSFYVFA